MTIMIHIICEGCGDSGPSKKKSGRMPENRLVALAKKRGWRIEWGKPHLCPRCAPSGDATGGGDV